MKRIFVLASCTLICSSTFVLGSITLTKIGVVVLVLIYLSTLLSGKCRFRIPTDYQSLSLYIFFALCLVSTLFSPFKDVSFRYLNSLLICVLLSILLYNLMRTHADFTQKLVDGVVIAALTSTAFGFLQVATGTFYMPGTEARSMTSLDGSLRANGLYDDPNYLGILLLAAWPLAFRTQIFKTSGLLKYIRPLIAIVIVLGVLSTSSRSSFVLLLLQITILGYLANRNKATFLFKIFVGITLILSIITVFNPLGLYDRFFSITNLVSGDSGTFDNSTAERLDLFFSGLKMFESAPIFGKGFGTFEKFSPFFMDFFPREVVAHNTYLTVLAETGLIGILLYSIYLFFPVYRMLLEKSNHTFVSFIGASLSIFFLVAHYFPTLFLLSFIYTRYATKENTSS